MERSNADSFSAYLKEKQRLESQPQSPPAGGTALSALSALAQAPDRRMTLPELQAASGMSFVDFADALKRLQASGYVTVSGAPSSETAELTRLGEDVVNLTRSA